MPTESIFVQTDKCLATLVATVARVNSTLLAAENLLGLMRQRMERMKKMLRDDEEVKNEVH